MDSAREREALAPKEGRRLAKNVVVNRCRSSLARFRRSLAPSRLQRSARAISLLASLSHSTELATAAENAQSDILSPTVPKAR